MRIITVNLANYKLVPTYGDIEGDGLCLIPQGGAPTLHYQRVEQPDCIVDTTGVTWTPTTKISISGTPEEYKSRVDWWFAGADDDSNYLAKLIIEFPKLDMFKSIEEIYNKALNFSPRSRKNNLSRFIHKELSKMQRGQG